MKPPLLKSRRFENVGAYIVLVIYSLIALFPIFLVFINSFKEKKSIFKNPFMVPTSSTFSLIGYEKLLERAHFDQYFANSIIVTIVSMFLILFFGSMFAFALSEYKFKGSKFVALFMSLGIMIPIRLGTVSILRLMVSLNLINTLTALVLVYTAQGLPITIFVLTTFMEQVPSELKEAARLDGASEYRIYGLVLPLVRPALATVAVFTMMPIWNDLWFPMILAPSESTKTVTYGAQQFIGQFIIDWNAVLSSLTLAMLPVIILYLLFSRSLIKGITTGAIK